MRHYTDYFTVDITQSPLMTREEINLTPDRWLDFYPHKTFVDICQTLLSILRTGSKSLWITGNLGTGKTNSALVLEKLFMDDESRVRSWLGRYANTEFADWETLAGELFARRSEGTLVVYDYNASSVGADHGLLVRLEKGVIAALKERNLSVPAMSNHERLLDRVKREGAHFFETRDRIQSRLAYLDQGFTDVEQLERELNNTEASSKLIADIETVLHEDSIYLNFDVPMFRKWIKEALSVNNLRNIVYIFDEFHLFIEANKEKLKTFEDIAESPGASHFFLIPVTHLDLTAYVAEKSETTKRANDRFHFRKIEMPNDTAFRLARHAIVDRKEKDIAAEWKKEKGDLWDCVSYVISKFNRPDDPARELFEGILPIHPMAAFLLKHLCEGAKSNQRSFFEYLKGSVDGTEFQDFIRAGGPKVPGKQFLTPDYLWHFFIDRSDLGIDQEIINIGLLYKQTCQRAFRNQTDDAPELRVLKTVLLFCLMDKLAPRGHERLCPTVENVELAFKGDGTIPDPVAVIDNLARNHCFSVVNGNISLFSMTDVKPEEVEQYRGKFHELLHEKLEAELESHTKNDRQLFPAGRFEIRVSDAGHTTLTNISAPTRDKYSKSLAKDDGSVCLWFVTAKDSEDALLAPEKIKSLLMQLRDHRILMLTFPQLTFCHSNANLWNEYIRQYAQYMTENDSTAKSQIHSGLDRIEREWFDALERNQTIIRIHRIKNEQVEVSDIVWSGFKDFLSRYVRESLPCGVDDIGFRTEFFGNKSLKAYARAGLSMVGTPGPITALVETMKKKGFTGTKDWFAQNPDHSLGRIHALFKKKSSNTLDRGEPMSVRKVFIELQRAPYGLRYNALSAFVLGYCLSDILEKDYQWTNGQISKPLDLDTLAEIIEAAVKGESKNEKLICRLSKEERKFIEKAPLMFGIKPLPDATVPTVLGQIQDAVEKKSAKVPLWMLPEYIHTTDEPRVSILELFVHSVCTAISTSSKGKEGERSNAVKDAGKLIRDEQEIVEAFAGYFKTENFLCAFEIYVDREFPQLTDLAKSVGDVSHRYCEAIREKFREAAGWLWNQADISKEAEDVLCEYEIIRLAGKMCGYTDFAEYKSVIASMQDAVTVRNHLPRQMIEKVRPVLSDFLAAIQTEYSPQKILAALQSSTSLIRDLFFDPSQAETLYILHSCVEDIGISNEDLLFLLGEMVGGFHLEEGAFLSQFRKKTEGFAKNSAALSIKNEWKRISDSEKPSDWAMSNGLPARYVFHGHVEGVELLNAVEHPENFAAGRLGQLLEIMKEIDEVRISECQTAFMTDYISPRYRKFQINLASLLNYLKGKFGQQPNHWPIHPDISDFIKGQYKDAIAPQIKEKLRSKSAEELKQRLLQLSEDHPDLGLLFWED